MLQSKQIDHPRQIQLDYKNTPQLLQPMHIDHPPQIQLEYSDPQLLQPMHIDYPPQIQLEYKNTPQLGFNQQPSFRKPLAVVGPASLPAFELQQGATHDCDECDPPPTVALPALPAP